MSPAMAGVVVNNSAAMDASSHQGKVRPRGAYPAGAGQPVRPADPGNRVRVLISWVVGELEFISGVELPPGFRQVSGQARHPSHVDVGGADLFRDAGGFGEGDRFGCGARDRAGLPEIGVAAGGGDHERRVGRAAAGRLNHTWPGTQRFVFIATNPRSIGSSTTHLPPDCLRSAEAGAEALSTSSLPNICDYLSLLSCGWPCADHLLLLAPWAGRRGSRSWKVPTSLTLEPLP
jgi:hypothetical protein